MTNAKFYKDLDIVDYHGQTDYDSKTMLSKFADCPKRYKAHYMDNTAQQDQTKSLRLGSAVHALALEPELWAKGYHVFPDHYYDGKGEKKEWISRTNMESYQEQMQIAGYDLDRNEFGKVVGFIPTKRAKITLSVKEHNLVQEMANAIVKDPLAYNILKAPGYVESSIFWKQKTRDVDELGDWIGEAEDEDAHTKELKLRCRPDLFRNDFLVPDIKIAASVKPEDFFKSAKNLNYDVSVALTDMGIQALHNREIDDYPFVVVEEHAPYIVEVYSSVKPMDEFGGMTYLDYGRMHLDAILRRLTYCRKFNKWPGYNPDGVGTMKIKEYDLRRAMEKGEF